MVKDDPENGSYGDCVRACIASMLELTSAEVPHFFETGDGEYCNTFMQQWLAERGLIAAFIGLPGKMSREEMFYHMISTYHDRYYMLWADFGSGDHAVVCRNDEIEHNPAWYRTPMEGPHSSGMWITILLAKL
jgi:hypothetical protein